MLDAADWDLAVFEESSDWEPPNSRLICRSGDHRSYARESESPKGPSHGAK